MDNKTNVRLEASASEDDQDDENLVRKIKNEATKSTNEHETASKRNIKIEANTSDASLQNERQCFSKYLGRDINYDTTMSNSHFEMDEKIIIKEEPVISDAELLNVEYLDCTNLATKIESDTITCCDIKMDIKTDTSMQEFVSDVTSVGFVMKSKKDSVNWSDRGVEMVPKREIDFQSELASASDISQANETKESDLERYKEAEDLTSSESPRLTRYAVYHDGGSLTFPDASDFKSANGKNVNKETSMRSNVCSFNLDPPCDSEHFESVNNMDDGGKLLYKCKICGKNVSSPWMRHSQRESHGCDTCEKCFKQKSDLKTDSLIPSGRKKAYKCDICGKFFTQKSHLKTHKLLHSGTKAHKCDICEKCFTLKSHLNIHKFLHSGIKPHKCEHCGKCFTQKSNLNQHKSLHSGTKPYKCEHCEKCFKRRSDLNKHKLLYSGTKPYKCDHCEKCFTQKSNLDQHKLLHSGTKPYKCDHCEKCFTQKSHLKTHKLLHSGTKPYKCDHCEKCFTQSSTLNKHRVLHSGTKP